jgi:hypothetical protein
MEIQYNELKKMARLAGVMYLLVIVIYMIGLTMNTSLHGGTFAASAENISGSEIFYRTTLVLMLMGSILTVFLAGALYAFLKPVNPNLARFALLFRICEIILGSTAKIALFIRLGIYTGTIAILSMEEQSAFSSLVRVFYVSGFNFSVLFFSFGSILFFYLMWTARFIPQLLSGFGILASVSVTVVALANLISPGLLPGNLWWMPIFIAEIATGLWLSIKSIDLEYWKQNSPGDMVAREVHSVDK